jgi:hypothetical protein
MSQGTKFFTDSRLKDFPTMTAYGLVFLNPCDGFRSPVKGGDLPIGIHCKDAVSDAVKDNFCLVLEGFFHLHRMFVLSLMFEASLHYIILH